MKLRKFLTLFLLSTGAFFVLSSQNVKADGTMCVISGTWCQSSCDEAYNACQTSLAQYRACQASCTTNQEGCFSHHRWISAWESWLWEVNLNIGDNFLILNEPNPICATYPDALVNCGSYEEATEIEACMLMVMQEQAHNNCP